MRFLGIGRCQLRPRAAKAIFLLRGFNLPSILKDVKMKAWTNGKKRLAF